MAGTERMSEVPDALSADAATLLELRLKVQRSPSAPRTAEPAIALLPLSHEQRRLWFLDQLTHDESAYNVSAAYRLRGPLNEEVLSRAFDLLLARHPILGARFSEVGGIPYQTIDAEAKVELERIDVTGEAIPAVAARQELDGWFTERLSLTDGPLLRVRLYRLGSDDHVLGLLVHHIVFDRDSLALLIEEISSHYSDPLGETTAPREMPAQYTSYVSDQLATASSLDDRLAFWRSRIGDAPSAIELPYDHARPPRLTPHAGEIEFGLDPDASEGIRELARSERTTPFVVGLAALQALLLKYDSTASAVTIGSPANGRESERYASTIGFFVRSLPVVLERPKPNTTLRRLIPDVRESYLSSHAHQDVPFDELVRISRAPRQLGLNPLFQVWYDLAIAAPDSIGRWGLHGIDAEQFETEQTATRFDLEFHLHDAGDQIRSRLIFSTALFEADTGARIAAHYERVLHAFGLAPETLLRHLDFVPKDERRMLVEEWSRAS
jgi:hypothetical protein